MKLYAYQEPVADLVFKYMIDNPGKHPLVAIPTGGGKSHIMADICSKAISRYPGTRVLMLSHVKEILKQNYDKMKLYTDDKVGLYSSGLDSRTIAEITIAGIQSVWRQPELFKDYRLIIIDEAHLIPMTGEGMYRSFFNGLVKPRYVGLTATPFRLGSGYIFGDNDETLFEDLVYDLTSLEKFNKLIEDGYLCNLVVKHTKLEMDVSDIKTKGGDYAIDGMSDKFDREKITEIAVKEIIKAGENYKKWLLFAIDIQHAEHICEQLIKNGIKSYIVHSKMKNATRDMVIQQFKDGQLRAIVNVNILTTGFDDPDIDMICLLRPTKSPVFHVQSIGRGLRIADGKSHCLVMDFAGNTERLGPINNVQIHKKKKGKKLEEPITKVCPKCDTIQAPAVRKCWCGYEFEFKSALELSSSDLEIIAVKRRAWHTVNDIFYKLHVKKTGPSSLLVRYVCGLRVFKEWVCLDHRGYVKYKADHWIRVRSTEDLGINSVNTALEHSSKLLIPKEILVDEVSKFPIIIDLKF